MKLDEVMNRIGKGRVMAITHDEAFQEEALIIKNETEAVYVLSSQVKVPNPLKFVGFNLEYLKGNKVNGRQYASVTQLQDIALVDLKAAYESDPGAIYEAEVLAVSNNSANIRIQHCIARLERTDITPDPVPLPEILEAGSTLPVRIKLIQKDFVQVEAIEKRRVPGVFSVDELQVDDLVYGIVNNTKTIKRIVEDSMSKSLHSFVSIAPGVDGLAPIQNHRPVETGQKVVFKINQINEDGRVRGKILRVISENMKPKASAQLPAIDATFEVGDFVTGEVKLIREDYDFGERIFVVNANGHRIIIPCSEMHPEDLAASELGWIGRRITVKLIEVGERLIGSKRQRDNESRQQFMEEWAQDPDLIKPAYVKEVGSIGYILRIGKEEVFLLKSDFRRIKGDDAQLDVNDKIYVQLKEIQGESVKVLPVLKSRAKDLAQLGVKEEDFHYTKRNELPSFEATIVKVMKKGAYLDIDGVRVFMPNTLFSLDLTRVIDVHQVGETIPVKLHAYVDENIVVRSGRRFIKETGLKASELSPGMMTYGIVRKIYGEFNPETGVNEQRIFTSIGFKLEGLSSQSQYFEVGEGDAVIFKVNQVREDGTIRGRLIRMFG